MMRKVVTWINPATIRFTCTEVLAVKSYTILLQFENDEFNFRLSSPVKPSFLLSSKGKHSLDTELKQVSKKPISSSRFTTKRCMAISEVPITRWFLSVCATYFFLLKDGCVVPLTVCYRTDLVKQDGDAPSLVHVYGMNNYCMLP